MKTSSAFFKPGSQSVILIHFLIKKRINFHKKGFINHVLSYFKKIMIYTQQKVDMTIYSPYFLRLCNLRKQ